MEARLKAIMEMDASDVQKELIKTTNELRKFERELAKSTDTNDIGRLTGRIRELNADMARLTQTANSTAKATAAVGAANKTAGVQSQNFARVIQDLPFGFMGIQNNLTQLIPGVGAAGLAFSALTAAITFSTVGLSYWTKGTKAATASLTDLTEYTKEFTKNAAEESVKARLLYEASNNVAISMDKRIRAAKELKDMYPEILKNYSAEDIALGKAAAGYKSVTAAILENARAQAAKNRITDLETQIQDRQFNIQKIKGVTDKESAAVTQGTVYVGERGAVSKLVTIEEKRAVIQDRRIKAIGQEQAAIDRLIASQQFFTKLAGGSTALQNSVIPGPEKTKATTSTAPTQRDAEAARMIAMNADFQQKKGKNWWRDTQTVQSGNTQIVDPASKRIEENTTLNGVLADQANIQAMLNEQLAGAAEIAEYGGQVFGQMFNAMLNGGDIGEVLVNAFKQIAVQIAAAVAQALIFAALLEQFPALKLQCGELF
jgi:hypothetical protein